MSDSAVSRRPVNAWRYPFRRPELALSYDSRSGNGLLGVAVGVVDDHVVPAQQPINIGDGKPALFPFGAGLCY